jgi:hypothetical protein
VSRRLAIGLLVLVLALAGGALAAGAMRHAGHAVPTRPALTPAQRRVVREAAREQRLYGSCRCRHRWPKKGGAGSQPSAATATAP